MKNRFKWFIPLLLLIIIIIVYIWPVSKPSFEVLYADVDQETAGSLVAFREANPLKTVVVEGKPWEYVVMGQGENTIVFLHGMTGAYDIWWQQMEGLQEKYRVIAMTYPAAGSLTEMAMGVMAIIDEVGIDQVNLVGSSLGGYFAQYLVANYPNRVKSAVFANTFPPNDLIAEQNRVIGTLLPYLPEWLIMNVLSGSIRESVYPTAEYSELVLAFGLEQTGGRMSKEQVIGRFHCVVDPFEAPDPVALDIAVLIIESDNDPLV
ncbi:MAG: alpha/beta hydrolase, partial [Firmicutes bacterium]|nr:alpha/beta hydrolase [Bacillota bacterium]